MSYEIASNHGMRRASHVITRLIWHREIPTVEADAAMAVAAAEEDVEEAIASQVTMALPNEESLVPPRAATRRCG